MKLKLLLTNWLKCIMQQTYLLIEVAFLADRFAGDFATFLGPTLTTILADPLAGLPRLPGVVAAFVV